MIITLLGDNELITLAIVIYNGALFENVDYLKETSIF